MDNQYKAIVYGSGHFEVLVPNTEVAGTLVEKLKSKLDLSRTYEMSAVLPRTARLYHEPIQNRPAVAVEVSRRNGHGILFNFRQASDRFPEDIQELARILQVDLLDREQTQIIIQ